MNYHLLSKERTSRSFFHSPRSRWSERGCRGCSRRRFPRPFLKGQDSRVPRRSSYRQVGCTHQQFVRSTLLLLLAPGSPRLAKLAWAERYASVASRA